MYDRILFPVDMANLEAQEKARATAFEFARLHDSELHVLTVVPFLPAHLSEGYLPEGVEKKALENVGEKLGDYIHGKADANSVHPRLVVREGTIYKEILRYAEAEDMHLIVMASHRPELKDYLIGPNAARVVRHSQCSVLVVRDCESA